MADQSGNWWDAPPSTTVVDLQPDRDAIRSHIEWLIEPARGYYDEALVEIAHDDDLGALSKARLFDFDQIDHAVDFAVEQNLKKRNVYIGAALRRPDTPRHARSRGEHFLVGTAVPVDIDDDYDATRRALSSLFKVGLTVRTGMTPTIRSQHWIRLTEPCKSANEYADAFRSLVMAIGADAKVHDAARVMRLGGTVSWPSERKREKKYKDELTRIEIDPTAEPQAVDSFLVLPRRADVAVKYEKTGFCQDGYIAEPAEIERDGFGLVINGRESHFRNIVLGLIDEFQKTHRRDPEPKDLWEAAFTKYCQTSANDDHRWTSENGQRELQRRVRRSILRLKRGYLPVASIETGLGGPKEKPDQAVDVWGEKAAIQRVNGAGDLPFIDAKALAAPRSNPPTFYNSSEFVGQYVPHRYLVNGIIRSQFLYALTARSGHGKTAVALALAASVALGQPFADVKTKKGRVLYLAGENAQDVTLRVRLLYEFLGVDAADVPIDFVVETFRFDEHYAYIKSKFEEVGGYSLIFIDTLQAFYSGDDDNDNTQMVQFARQQLRPLLELPGGPCVIVLSHPNKTAGKEDLVPRGGSAFMNELDANLILWRDKTSNVVSVSPHAEKFRGEPFDPLNFTLKPTTSEGLTLDGDGNPARSVVAVFITEQEIEQRNAEDESLENRVLLHFAECKRQKIRGSSIRKLCTVFGISKRRADGVLGDLAKAKLIAQTRPKSPFQLTDKGEAEVARLRADFRDSEVSNIDL